MCLGFIGTNYSLSNFIFEEGEDFERKCISIEVEEKTGIAISRLYRYEE
jgi:hypothetical protein